jgi:hypothetical protein
MANPTWKYDRPVTAVCMCGTTWTTHVPTQSLVRDGGRLSDCPCCQLDQTNE